MMVRTTDIKSIGSVCGKWLIVKYWFSKERLRVELILTRKVNNEDLNTLNDLMYLNSVYLGHSGRRE